MTMHEHTEWTDKLSNYLDGELSDQEQRAVGAHVAGCVECSRTLHELRAVVERARTLAPAEPSADLWKAVADRIAVESNRPVATLGTRRRFSFTWPELIAASVLLVLVSGWAALHMNRPAPTGSSADLQVRPSGPDLQVRQPANTAVPPRTDVVPANFDETEYDAAVADLQRALQSGRGQLDPSTVKIVEQNLAIIDQAVDDARRALAQDPANADLSGYLQETKRRKLDLLRHAAALAEDFN
jgi:negative regulator of sigma E activity